MAWDKRGRWIEGKVSSAATIRRTATSSPRVQADANVALATLAQASPSASVRAGQHGVIGATGMLLGSMAPAASGREDPWPPPWDGIVDDR